MRILQIAPVAPEIGGVTAGGIATHVWGLATHLAEQGHDVAVLADNRPFDEPWPDTVDGVDVFGTLNFSGSPRNRRLLRASALGATIRCKRQLGEAWRWRWVASKVAAFRAVFDAFEPDVVHVHALESGFAVAYHVSAGRLPIVATLHSTHYFEYAEPSRREYHRELVRQNMELVTDVVFVSRFVEQRYERLFPGRLAHARTHVLINPIDASLFTPVARDDARAALGLEGEGPLLLFVNNLIPRKAPSTFVQAVAELRWGGVPARAVIVGDGPEEGLVRELVSGTGLDGHVRLDGFRPQDALADYYSAADVFVMPSLMESFGLVALESMLCGCPVVGTPEVLPEVVPDEFGVYVPSHEATDLAGGIASALERQWDREAMRRHALGYDWDERVGAFERMYAQVIGDHARDLPGVGAR